MATQLDLADAQLLGFALGKNEGNIISLITSMGLTKKEWKKWKDEYPNYLSKLDFEDADVHFNTLNKKG